MKTLFAAIVLSCLLWSCEDSPQDIQHRTQTQYNQESSWLAHEMRYYHDEHTNLCYAVMWLGGNASVMTNIPCNGVVMDRAQNFKSDK